MTKKVKPVKPAPTEPPELTALREEAGGTRFGREAVARAEGMRFGINTKSGKRDLDLPWTPGCKRWRTAAAMARRFIKAARIARDAVGMLAKVDKGERTRTGRRVRETGIVLQATAAFRYTLGSEIRYVLRIRRQDGKTWDQVTKITAVYRLSA